MSINSNVVSTNIDSLEYNKFVEIVNDTRFPALTVIRTSYDDNLTQTSVYNKNAVLTYDVGAQDINASPFGDNGSSDAFGRLRVSLPNSLFDAKLIYNKLPEIFDEVISNGTSVHNTGDSCVTMSTLGTGAYVIRQTRARFNYQPGKSLMGVFTFVASPEVNIVKRVGLFHGSTIAPHIPDDGLYLEITSSGPSFNIVKTQGTSAGTLTYPQSAWNIDTLNGYGASGLTLDFTKAQIFAIDYEWLGVGRVRFGFYINGKLYYAHQVTHYNALTNVYMSSPNQPVRYEIRQTGAGSGSLKQICSTVIDEGVPEELGTTVTAYTTAVVTVQNGVMTPILGIRVNPIYDDTVISLKNFEIFNTDNTTNIRYTIYRNAGTNRDVAWQNANGSQMQFLSTSANTIVSGGYEIYSGFSPKSQGTSANLEAGLLPGLAGRFGSDIDGTPETLIIGGMGLGSSATVLASINALQQF